MQPSPLIVTMQQVRLDPFEQLRSTVGGKAANLFKLASRSFNVPPIFAIASDAFKMHVQPQSSLERLIDQLSRCGADRDRVATLTSQVQHEIRELELDDQFRDSIATEFQALIADGSAAAIRSSASDEDGADHSFAGMHDSFLFVRDLDRALECIKQVWASAFNSHAVAYRIENRLPIEGIAVGVVVQKMIDAVASGVVFTINPANSRTDQVLISSVWGAGDGLVSGQLAADTFVHSKAGEQVSAAIAEKSEQLVWDRQSGYGLTSVLLEKAQAEAASLNVAHRQQLVQVAIEIENLYRRPQDIEFCLDASGELFILQARPVTRVAEYGPAAGNRLTWDNSNIIESYSGVTTPMTFSFIRRAYTIVYHCFAEVMGIGPERVKASRHVFENMLGLIRGRVFYNLQNWYRLIRLFPGYQYNAQFMESMMGLKQSLQLDEDQTPPTFWRRYLVELPALVRLLLRTSWNFLWIRKTVDQFQDSFQLHYARWDAMNFADQAPHQLKALYHEMEDALLWNWKAPIINDFYVMIYFGLLRKLCQKWAHDQTGALQNDLICGEGGVESAEPARMLLRMASHASQNDVIKAAIFSEPLEEVPVLVKSTPGCEDFQQAMEHYLDRYGFLCMNELKLEEFSLRDRPHVVYQVLRNYLSLEDSSALDVDAMQEREQRVRREAEQRAFQEVGRGLLGLPRRWVFQRILRNARLGVKNRENMRFARTRIYGIVRELLRAIGQQFADEGLLKSREDIFYLTIDEVWDFIKGTAVTTELAKLVALRRAEFDGYRDTDPPDDRFDTFGPVYHRNLFAEIDEPEETLVEGQLKGTGCCPGKLTREVRVLKTPQDNLSLSGQILVAERTDPGWVPLYPAVSGILIERGSVLSHSAVVAREMGIPTIVGIKGLLAAVADGDRVTMDGSSGIVELDVE